MNDSDLIDLFFKHRADCPWHEDGKCSGTKGAYYGGQLNDERVRIDGCDYDTCPIFYWEGILK